MRWIRRGLGDLGGQRVPEDPGRQRELLHDVRTRFGVHVPVRFAEQAAAVVPVLDGDDGLIVAAGVLREFTDAAEADLLAQAAELYRHTGRVFTVDRRNYRPLWQAAGRQLRWPLFALPCGFHPYVQVAAAVTVVGTQARRTVRVTDPPALLSHVFEVLDLSIAGWQYGRVRLDVDAAALAERLIFAARELRSAMADPPPLPPPVRELMRSNAVLDVHDAAENRIVARINPGQEMRQSLLV